MESSVAGENGATDERLLGLGRILRSRSFCASPSARQILKYLVEKSVLGNGESIKEYSIATEALGRGSDFDPKADNIVRVQVQRLRKKLEEYYEHEGAEDQIRIVIPRGRYTPEYLRFPWVAESTADQEGSMSPNAVLSRADTKVAQAGWKIVALALILLTTVVGFILFWRSGKNSAASQLPGHSLSDTLLPLWQPFISRAAPPPLIVFSNPLFLGDKKGDLFRFFPSSAPLLPEGARVPSLAGLNRPWPLPPQAGTLYYSEVYTGIGEAVAAARVGEVLATQGKSFSIQRSETVSIDGLRDANVIFLGSALENAVLRELPVEAQLIFQGPTHAAFRYGLTIHDVHPGARDPSVYRSQVDQENGALKGEYALVSLFPCLTAGRFMMVLAGLSTLGTEAAAQFATSPRSMRTLDQKLAASRGARVTSPYFQGLLAVQIRNGAVTKTDCVFVRHLLPR